MFVDMWRETSLLGLLGVTIAVGTVLFAILYALRPGEARLALMRPLSLATIFAALCSFCVSIANVLNGISVTGNVTAMDWRAVAAGTRETFVALFVAFGCLAISWLCVALGMRRAP
jgi:hypothetical protein